MKKFISLVLAAAMIFSLAACGAEKEETAEIANPNVSYDSLEEINSIVGCNLAGPGAMGTTDESFIVIDGTIAEYTFTQGGFEYVFRAAKTMDDITGIYVDGTTAFANEEITDKLVCLTLSDGMVGRWFDGDMQYTLYRPANEKGELNQEDFVGICAEMIAQTCPEIGGFFNQAAGSYQDSYSQRAMMDVMSFGNYAVFTVQWGSSAFETDYWNMTVTKDGDHYAYTDCTHQRITTAENGDQTVETIGENLSGYFELTDAGLAWTGASEENVQDCVFVLMQ